MCYTVITENGGDSMANAADKNACIRENLLDAGLSEECTDKCMKMLDNGDITALEKLLADHRRELLEGVHKYTSQLDCLDYFTYNLRKEVH